MARIAGIDLPKEKRVEVGLTYIYGIGASTARKILAETGVNPDIRVKNLSEEEENLLRTYVNEHVKVEGDLRREVALNINREQEEIRRQENGKSKKCQKDKKKKRSQECRTWPGPYPVDL